MRLETELREMWPNGHKNFIDLCLKEMELHSNKNHEYAAGGNPLGNFYRVSALKRLYPAMDWASPEGTAVDFMLKQLDAVLWGLSTGIAKRIEGLDERLADVSVYTKITRLIIQEGNQYAEAKMQSQRGTNAEQNGPQDS